VLFLGNFNFGSELLIKFFIKGDVAKAGYLNYYLNRQLKLTAMLSPSLPAGIFTLS